MKRNKFISEDPYSAGFVDIFSNTIALLLFFFFVFIIFQFLLQFQLKDSSKKTLSNKTERVDLQAHLQSYNAIINSLEGKIIESDTIKNNLNISNKSLSEQIIFLHAEISKLNQVLEADKIEMEQKEIEIFELGKQLNRALANKTADLMEYRSEFLENLNKSIGTEKNIERKGDRFILQGELLFASGSDFINDNGKKELDKIAIIIKDLITKIPQNTNWILRIDGHTDDIPLNKTNKKFKNNFDLSYARASAVVDYLISRDVPAFKLVPTGFGQYQPLYPNDSMQHRSQNRRIEFQLTNP